MPLMSEHMQPKGCNAAEIGHEVRPVQFMDRSANWQAATTAAGHFLATKRSVTFRPIWA
jgi:hypothetical protein